MTRRFPILIMLLLCAWQASCRENVVSSGNTEPSVASSPSESRAAHETTQEKTGEEHFAKANSLSGHAPEEALIEYGLAIEKGYDTVELRLERGAFQLKRHKEGNEDLKVAIKRDFAEWRAHWSLALSALEMGDYELALKETKISDELDDQNEVDYGYHLGRSLEGLGRYERALKEYTAFIQGFGKQSPNSPDVIDAQQRVKAIRRRLGLGEGN